MKDRKRQVGGSVAATRRTATRGADLADPPPAKTREPSAQSTAGGQLSQARRNGSPGQATPDAAGAEEKARSDALSLGRLVRSIRVSKDLSIEALAKASGVSAGGISQIERGVGNPAFTTLVKLAYGMQVPVGSFLRTDAEPTGMVVRPDRRKRLVPSEGLVYELLTPDLNRRLEVLRVQIACGFDNSEQPFIHEGEECVHLLSGELLIYIDGTECKLEEGDSITFSSPVPHWYRNPFPQPAIIFSAVTPPSF
jgi:transcriptional regulator with XRE-family HTH domain